MGRQLSRRNFVVGRALVTGASSGIGRAMATALASRGSDLVLVARRGDRLEALAAELAEDYGVRCEAVVLDLSMDSAGRRLRELVGGEVDLVVNNAGFATQGSFVDTPADDLAREIAVDIRAVVDVSRAFLPAMVARRHGAIINVASTTAFQPVPTLAVYAASKAFVLRFTQALWFEARADGVIVFCLSPGPTQTEFFDAIGENATVVGRMQTADQVAATALRALERRSPPPHVVSGRRNSLTSNLVRFAPLRVLLPGLARGMHPIHRSTS